MATASSKRRPAYDPTVYPSEDHMGEGSLQRFISDLFRQLLERWLAAKGTPTFVGANQFIYWKQFDPSKHVAPDVYVLPGVEPGITTHNWKTWETNVIPTFALEVVSSRDYLTTYRDGPERYDELGAREVVIFDPEHADEPGERLRFQVYRRLARRGLVRVEATNDLAVRSRVLGCWLRSVGGDDGKVRLRIGTGTAGDDLVLTTEEGARAAREREQSARKGEQAAQATARLEIAAREAVEAENEKLRAELAQLRGKRR